MRRTIAQVSALLLGLGLLLLGSGLFGTLLGIRASIEGFGATVIGLQMAAFYGGFMAGSSFGARFIERAGHIRAFAALASLLSAIPLLHALLIDPIFWGFLRAVTGLCVGAIYLIIESWLNAATDNANRGRVLSIYMIVSLLSLGGGQVLITFGDPATFKLFSIVTILTSIAVFPVAMTRTPVPPHVVTDALGPRRLYRLSPLGAIGCLASGLLMGAFWGMTPVYAHEVGMTSSGIAYFMALSVLGGLATQWPLGWLSDKVDRRLVLTAMFLGIAVFGAGAAYAGSRFLPSLYVFGIIFGALAFPVYSICVAHVNDFPASENPVSIGGGLLILYGGGATAGPVIAGAFMGQFGADWLFAFYSAIGLLLGAFAVHRMSKRSAPTEGQPYVAILRTTPAIAALDPRIETEDVEKEASSSEQSVDEADALEPAGDSDANRPV